MLAWRDRLERLAIKQPFKQAHREVYLLTDAERRTGTYSNRFAAHVLKQHQFHALCAARGWKNKLRMSVDDSYPPATRLLPEWNLRAEFWIEGIGDDYTESYAYLYLGTDQVRFYPIDAAQSYAHASGGGYRLWNAEDRPLTLDDVPPLVLSEIMRDVDLFVGVASVGNDPNWADGGPGGRHLDYWQRFSFGTLSATAETRKAVLERIVPRLKIADRCRFSDKFLIVRGDLRTYKIHLGSGNILMEPNDQYLCIVPKQTASANPGEKVFLPFEGDNVLSIILSKALMLADDRKIKDASITSGRSEPGHEIKAGVDRLAGLPRPGLPSRAGVGRARPVALRPPCPGRRDAGGLCRVESRAPAGALGGRGPDARADRRAGGAVFRPVHLRPVCRRPGAGPAPCRRVDRRREVPGDARAAPGRHGSARPRSSRTSWPLG